MSNLQSLPQKSEIQIREFNISSCLAVAFERTRTEPFDITKMVKDILSEFNHITDAQIRDAIRNGGLGKYGVSYKLSTQVVCFWIREYLRDKKPKLGL